jgi:hypothetical protein
MVAGRLAHDHQTVTKVKFSEILQVGVPFCPRPGVDISLQIGKLRVVVRQGNDSGPRIRRQSDTTRHGA